MNTYTLQNQFMIIPPPPIRFTLDEWYLNNMTRSRHVEDQQQLAKRILNETERLISTTDELTKSNKNETNHYIQERIKDIEFNQSETSRLRKEVLLEIEALNTDKERILDALASIERESLVICRKCIMLREKRIGIDLVEDEVDKELRKEINVIEGAQSLFTRTLQQATEQIRRLRSIVYFIDRDLELKSNVLNIDRHISNLNEKSFDLNIYHGHIPLASSMINIEEWESANTGNRQRACAERDNSIRFRNIINAILKQTPNDLKDQNNIVNQAFLRRIKETKEIKIKLELQHSETVRQMNEITRNITNIEKAIAEKEGFLALAHTRLGFRTQRSSIELCKDDVEFRLVKEVDDIKHSIVILQQIMTETQASLRYLLKTQIQLEEDINIKTNTLKIDEVDCFTLRQGMRYEAY